MTCDSSRLNPMAQLEAQRVVTHLRAMARRQADEKKIVETLGFVARWGLYRELGFPNLAAFVEDVLG